MCQHIADIGETGVTGMITVSVTRQEIDFIIEHGSELCKELRAIDNIKEVCYDEWYGPYIYCMVHDIEDERTLVEASEIVDMFLKRERCNQQPKSNQLLIETAKRTLNE